MRLRGEKFLRAAALAAELVSSPAAAGTAKEAKNIPKSEIEAPDLTGEYFLSKDSVLRKEGSTLYEYGTYIETNDVQRIEEILKEYNANIRAVSGYEKDYKAILEKAMRVALRDKFIAQAVVNHFKNGGTFLAFKGHGGHYTEKEIQIGLDDDESRDAQTVAHEVLHGIFRKSGIFRGEMGGGMDHYLISPLEERFLFLLDLENGRLDLKRASIGYLNTHQEYEYRNYGPQLAFDKLAAVLEKESGELISFIESGEFQKLMAVSLVDGCRLANEFTKLTRRALVKIGETTVYFDEDRRGDVQPRVYKTDYGYQVTVSKPKDVSQQFLAQIDDLKVRAEVAKLAEKFKDPDYQKRKDHIFTDGEMQDVAYLGFMNGVLIGEAVKFGASYAKQKKVPFNKAVNSPEVRAAFRLFKKEFLKAMKSKPDVPAMHTAKAIASSFSSFSK